MYYTAFRGVGILILIFCFGKIVSQDINFKASLFQVKYTDEQWPGISPVHQGYSFGADILIRDAKTLIIPGIYFSKTSLQPQEFEWKNPLKEHTDIKTLKVPFQLGGHIIHSDLFDLNLHGGIAATYLLGIDENNRLTEDDFNDLRGSFLVGATARIFFLTVHVGYEYGFSKIYLENAPSGIKDSSKEKIFSIGIGVYF